LAMGGVVSSVFGSRTDKHDDPGLFRLTYSSRLVASTDAEAEKVIGKVIASALKHNPRYGITGMLYYCNESKDIVQVLEGSKAAVMGLFSVIEVDTRHMHCRILNTQTGADDRLYSGWGMALMRLTEVEKAATVKKLSKSRPMGAPNNELMHHMRLQYSSTLLANDADAGRQQIAEILEKAVPFNQQMRIGGLLCFNPATQEVTQILEGPAPAVLELFDRISVDPRHRAVSLTGQELVIHADDLQFDARWGMMQTETSEEQGRLVEHNLASRLRQAYASFDQSLEAGGAAASTSKRSKASRQHRIDMSFAKPTGDIPRWPVHSTPAEFDAM